MAITDKEMQRKPTDKDQWFSDDWGRGDGRFLGRVTPAGRSCFYFRYTLPDGKRDTMLIGDYSKDGKGGYTLADARAKALEWSKLYKGEAKKNLREHFAILEAEAKRAEQEAREQAEAEQRAAELERERRITVRKLFDRWCLVDLKPHLKADGKRAGRKDGGQYSREQFERHVFPSIGDVAVADVRKTDVMTILDSLKSEGKLRTCNVLLADMKQMFAFALGRDLIERNPLDTVTKRQAGGTDSLRERVLTVDEIAKLHQLIPHAKLNQRTAAAIWMLLSTGARIGELMGAVWRDEGTDLSKLAALPEAQDVKVGIIDMDAKTWHLPTTKNEREHTIHLSDFAIKHLEHLHTLRERDGNDQLVPWVFPNSLKAGPVCVKSFGKQLADRQRPADARMSGRSKRTESLMLTGGKWTAHDLRRTAGTLMASLGVSGDVIDECLNHVIESRVRRTYIRDRRPAEQARAFDALGEKLEQIVSGTQAPCNVVQLRAAG